jgi:signal transduction histidine kinase
VMHSRAATISIELAVDSEYVHLTVSDDGIGFDPYATHEGHFGISIMRERAAAGGGACYLDSSPGQGTVLRLSIPISQTSPS